MFKKSVKAPLFFSLTALLCLLTFIFLACNAPSPDTSTATANSQSLSGTITEAGSTTVQPLAEKLAEAFKAKNPRVNVTIQGGGSSVGIKSAIDGTVDIGASSRELKPEEKAQLVEHIIAKDGIAVIVHPSNPISNLSKDQVRDIFAGKIANWKDLGGANKTITFVAREEGSGTRAAFDEMVMGKELISNKAILQSSNGAIRTTVAGDPASIGFISFGYIDKSVKALSINNVEAKVENVLNGKYPISRPLLFVTKSEPQGVVKAFIDFCLSQEGQAIVAKEGYIPVK